MLLFLLLLPLLLNKHRDGWHVVLPCAVILKFIDRTYMLIPKYYVAALSGRSRIKLRRTGEVFSLVPPNSTAHNLIMGSTWVDCHGTFRLFNTTTGDKCILQFTPCGWFSDGRYQVRRTHARPFIR